MAFHHYSNNIPQTSLKHGFMACSLLSVAPYRLAQSLGESGASMVTVMVLDEERDSLALLKRLLERSGHDVLTCAGQDDAFEMAESRTVDLAVIALRGEREEFPEFLKRLKTAREDLRIMVIADYLSDEGVLMAETHDSLIAPLEIEVIERKVKELLERPMGRTDAELKHIENDTNS